MSNEKATGDLISEHKDISNHSIKRKLLTILEMWIFWGFLYGGTHIPAVRDTIIRFVEENNMVHWLVFWSGIILYDLLYVGIIFLIGSIIILVSRKKYSGLKIYEEGLGFLRKNGQEEYASYQELNLNYGKWKSSVRIECKRLNISEQLYFKDFSQPDVMETNLLHRGVWGAYVQKR